MDGPILSVQPNQVVGESARIKAEGYRFVTLSYVRGAPIRSKFSITSTATFR